MASESKSLGSRVMRARTHSGYEGRSTFAFFRDYRGIDDLRRAVPGLEDYQTPVYPKDVVVDCQVSLREALRGLPVECPRDIVSQQEIIHVFYLSFDDSIHVGQVVIHNELASDVQRGFTLLLQKRVPVGSVIPVSDPRFERDGRWDDEASMSANNSYGFNYRKKVTPGSISGQLSLHALGMALDINPMLNPCYGSLSDRQSESSEEGYLTGYQNFLPINGRYDMSYPGTFHEHHPLVIFLEGLGWTWGGRWTEPKDLHHFQKIPCGFEKTVERLRSE